MGCRRENPKNTNKIINDIIREARTVGVTRNSPVCKRWKNRLCDTISENERHNLFQKFWKEMSQGSKKMFVCSTVKIKEMKQKPVKGGNSKRGYSSFYFLRVNGKEIPVVSRCTLILSD